MKTIKKAQKGTYITTKKGTVGRTNGLYGPYESIDTTGYSKGKKEFELKSSVAGLKPTTKKIKREDVPKKIKEFKKGATKSVSYKRGGNISKKQTGGPITLGSVKRNLLDPSIGQKVVNENPRQQKRLNRIKQTNPERAARVENRMVRRANRAMGARGAASRMKKGGSIKKK